MASRGRPGGELDRLIIHFAVVAIIASVAIGALARPGRAGTRVADPRQVLGHAGEFDSTRVVKREFGAVFGYPAIFNLEAGYWPDPRVGFRASGFYWGHGLLGLQGDCALSVARQRRGREAIALVGGTIQSSDSWWNYAGLALDWNLDGFFLEVGPVWGSGNDRDIFQGKHSALLFQVGFLGGGGILGPR